MKSARRSKTRKGSILPLTAIGMMALFGFVALAVDLGVIALARSQCQNVADSAAMSGVRALNGDESNNNNYSNVLPTAQAAVSGNFVLSKPIEPGNVTVDIGSYWYDTNTARFVPNYTGKAATDNWSLVRAKVSFAGDTQFARVMGINTFDTSAVATAVHRPRDVAIIMDFSGSMRFASLPGVPHSGARAVTGYTPDSGTNNPESVYPTWGHYSQTTLAGLRRTSSVISGGNVFAPCNFTESNSYNDFRKPIVGDFYQHVSGGAATKAFTPVPDSNVDAEGFVTVNGGDRPWRRNFNASGQPYARTVAEILNMSTAPTNSTPRHTWEDSGYGPNFAGYTLGPRYWGKTFFLWPPDPRGPTNLTDPKNNGAKDWRKRFFLKPDGITPVDDNSILWDAEGRWRSPRIGSTEYYKINYRAIIHWLKNSGANPFPPRLRAGRLKYYDALPNENDLTLNTRWWTIYPLPDLNERFWKDYIDYVLGCSQRSATSWEATSTNPNVVRYTGYGDDFTWSSNQITALSSLTAVPKPYMRYDDSPRRPRTHFWFGPMTMVDFLGNYNLGAVLAYAKHWWWPGTAHESPLYPCKLGMRAALQDIKENHPNDYVSLIFFSVPLSSVSDTSNGRRFNRVRTPLGRNYVRMIDSLWYPPYTLDNPGTEINIYDMNQNLEVPRAMGGTCYPMGLMLAYNQFSTNSSLRTYNPSPAPVGDAGGNGRRGAQKIVIFLTDGLPNYTATASLVNNGSHNSYYRIRFNSSLPSASEFPSVASTSDNSSTVTSQIFSLCNQLVASENASPPGYSSSRYPVLIHCMGFGQVFDTTSPVRDSAIATLAQMETIGNVPANKRINTVSYKIITGDDAALAAKLQSAITKIMQDGKQVSLIE